MNDRDFNLPLLVPNLALLLLVAVGLLNPVDPLISTRPPGRGDTALEKTERYAHLWQDPFGVAPPKDLPESRAPALLSSLEADTAGVLKARAAHPGLHRPDATFRVLVLPALLDSRNEPALIETRLRTRYAVLSALARAQYVPAKPDRLTFHKIAGSSLPPVVYEQFHVRYLVADNVEMTDSENSWRYPVRDATAPAGPTARADRHDFASRLVIPHSYDHVVVCWLDEARFLSRDDAARTLSDNIATLVKSLLGDGDSFPISPKPGDPTRTVTWTVKAIGPSTSDLLVSLLEPAASPPPASAANDARFELLSPRATASTDVLNISLRRGVPFRQELPDVLPGAPQWRFTRTIATDGQLVDTLLEELARRQISPGPAKHLVLVGEWDSLYSRGLGRAFAARLNELRGEASTADRVAWSGNPPYLHEFSYLAGLDGHTADPDGTTTPDEPTEKKTDDEGGKAEKSADDGPAKLERAIGPSQYDYLRRLATDVRRLQIRLDEGDPRSGRGEIAAIGVIGSDLYDKLLVLRALRSSFPRAVFFTTDLDALFLHRKESAWTSNLLVASSFGLTAHEDLQDRIPPFRDGYQTALYLTVLQAVGVTSVGGAPFKLDPAAIKPRLFELGRTRYFDLSAPEPPAGSTAAPLHPGVCGQRYRGWHVLLPLALLLLGWIAWRHDATAFYRCTFALLSCVALAGFLGGLSRLALHFGRPFTAATPAFMPVGIGLIWLFHHTSDQLFQLGPPTRGHRSVAFAGVAACLLGTATFAAMVVTVIVHRDAWGEELFAWFEGVSIWPTEIVRAFAAIIAVLGVVYAQIRLEVMKQSLGHQFALPSAGALPKLPRLSRGSWRRWLQSQWLAESRLAPEYANAVWRSRWERGLWLRYCYLTSPQRRLWRVLACLVVYFLIILWISGGAAKPVVPARGAWSISLDQGILFAASFAYCYLLFFVFDATVLAAGFIDKLTQNIGHPSFLKEVDVIRLFQEIAGAVSSLVYTPFSVLLMLIVSRNKLFDSWEWPPMLIGVFFSGLVLIIFTALLLQHRARRAKHTALAYFDQEIVNLLRQRRDGRGLAFPDADAAERLLVERRDQIKNCDGPIFQPWHYNPIFRAILIPLGGIGSLQLLEQFGGLLGR